MRNLKSVFVASLFLIFLSKTPASFAQGAPANDDCANATAIGEGTFSGNTSTATGDGGASCGASFGPDVWFLYTATVTGTVSATLTPPAANDFDSVLSLHDPTIDGCPGDPVDEIACNDDCAPLKSCLTFSATSGTQYLIRIGGFEGANGDYTLNVFPSGEISGTVRDSGNSNPLSFAKVEVYNSTGALVSAGITDAVGAYSAKNLVAGTHYAKTSNVTDYINELYDNIVCEPTCDPLTGTPITVTVGIVTTGSSTSGIDFALDPTPTCLFCDDFNDGLLATNWTYTNGNWSEVAGNLVGTHTKKANAIANPAFVVAGCSSCTVTAVLQTIGGPGNKVSVFGWHVDKKNNVELLMKEENEKWVLKQRVNGAVVAKAKFLQTIDPNTFYTADLSFDGTNFQVMIDGAPIITLPAIGVPNGTVGFQVKRTTGNFDSISVN